MYEHYALLCKWNLWFLPPANEVCEGYVFTGVCLSTGEEDTCVVAGGGGGGGRHAWLLAGGMHGCRGACMVAGGACVVARGWGMHGCREGMHGCEGWGACVVVGGACVVVGGMCGCWGACIGYDETRSMSGRYASYWNAFLCFCSFLEL